MKHVHLNECDSTQDVLKEQLSQGEKDLLVSCDHQTKGRGRGEHIWMDMPGTLCFSFSAKAHVIPSFSALEISTLVTRFFEYEGNKLKLKWPNDIWNQDSKKCCGILIQNTSETMIVGVGLNLFSDRDEFGGVYPTPFVFDKKSWAKEIVDYIHNNRYSSTEALKKDWMERCFHLNKYVTISEGSEISTGIFEGLGKHGEAVLDNGGQKLKVFNGSLRPIR